MKKLFILFILLVIIIFTLWGIWFRGYVGDKLTAQDRKEFEQLLETLRSKE